MTFMRRVIDALNMENWKKPITNERTANNKYEEYYNRINKEKANNLNISYNDVSKYDMKPFDLNKDFITDGNFMAIELDGKNLDIAYQTLQFVNEMLTPYRKYYSTSLPSRITTEYLFGRKLPHSHLRLNPYTHSHEENEFPLLLWIAYSGDYGNEYLYKIYFDANGKIGSCDLQFYNYTVQIRKKDGNLFVKKISKTLKEPPYGTKTLYIYDQKTKNTGNVSKKRKMSENDLELFMVECNAKVAHDEEMATYDSRNEEDTK